MTEENIDPTRTFELDEQDWEAVLASVRKDGYDDWNGYAPQIIAAITEGYLDSHLQMLGRFLRQRYLHLKDATGNLAPAYVPSAAGGSAQSSDTNLEDLIHNSGLDMLPKEGINPTSKVYDDDESVPRAFFKARGWRFRKHSFLEKHFITELSAVGCRALYKIESIGMTKIEVVCVAVEKGTHTRHVGRVFKFDTEKQRHWYNIP